jgi:HK97 family phage portal protein
VSVAENQRALVAQSRAVEQPELALPREYRDPSAATQQVRYTAKDAPQVAEWNADNAIRQGYLANVIAYRCVQIIADTIASLPFRAGPDLEKRTQWDSRAPLAKLLGPAPNGPAPKLSARKLFAWSIAQRLVTGRFAWEIELDNAKNPVAFWPLPVAHLKPIPADGGNEWFTKFQYGRSDKPRNLRPDQVFYDWEPGQLDFREPESALQASRYDLSVAVMADRYSYAFLKNGAMPAAVVITEAFPDTATFERFKQNWRGQYQGPDNGGMVHFQEAKPDRPEAAKLSDAIYVQSLGVSQKDAQFIDSHKQHLQMIAISLGVHWSKLDASGRTFDNAKEEDKSFWQSTLFPHIRDLEDAINMDLAPRVGSDAGWFDLTEVESLKPDRRWTFTGADVNGAINAGWLKPNEVRADQNLEELPELEDWEPCAPPSVPSPFMHGEGPSAQPEMPTDVMPPGMPADMPAPARAQRRLHAADPAGRRALDQEAVEFRRASTWRAVDTTVRAFERQWEASMGRLFARQERSVIQALRGKRGAKMLREPAAQVDPSAVFNKAYWTALTSEHVIDLYDNVATSAGVSVSAKFGQALPEGWTRTVQEMIQARSNQLAGQVTQTTYDEITRVLADGVGKGASIDDLATGLSHVFQVASDSRATTIARTEVISAYNGSAQMAAEQMPSDVVGGQEWIATRDGVTREDHAAADGQTVPMGEPFDVGGEMLDYPGDENGDPANTINCRCTVGFLTPDEMDSQEAERSADLGVARVALAMVEPGSEINERALRSALRRAA